MNLSRRGFLGTLAAAIAGMTLDPERLLWVPGQKTIFLPSSVMPCMNTFITPTWVTQDTAMFWRNSVKILRDVDVRYNNIGYRVRERVSA